jgi:tRNA (guanine37-N1)-methyltransferase
MIIDILTIFPGMMAGPLQESIIGKAIARELIEVHVTNIRDYARRMIDHLAAAAVW